MPEIELRENKVLKLINVLSRPVPQNEILDQSKQAQMLMNWIKAKGYGTVGPLILYSSGIKGIDANGQPVLDAKLMVQLKTDSVRLEPPYEFDRELRVAGCLLARYEGSPENLQFTTSKLTLYAYEHELTLTGEIYTILIEQTENKLLADVFMPVKSA